VLVNEHPEIPDNLLELPGSIVGIDETPEAAVIRGVKEKTSLDVANICFVFSTSITNVFDCGKVDAVAQSDLFTIEHHPSLDNVNWK
jgi:8-oxo-dGTP pyrophosphatase MutT (NUDIX family)